MRLSSFTHNFLLMFSGPLIWAVHFVSIYGFTGILCARPPVSLEWLGVGAAVWVIAAASMLAIMAMAALYLFAKPRDAAPDNRVFIRWMSATLSLLSGIAIVWEALAAFLVPLCK
jgi:NO-binding membrane sensor protein with MHYT domain